MFAKANKHSRFTHVGLRLWKTPNDHQVLIVHIDDHSIFARSGLKVGMKIDRINKFVCDRNNSNLDQIYAILNDAIGELVIYTLSRHRFLQKKRCHQLLNQRKHRQCGVRGK
jgi:C-terminal processing protease CtpA/Prc